MKTTLFASFLTLATLFGFANTSFAQSSGNSFVVTNQQSESVGQITVTAPGGNYYLTLPGNASDTIALSDTAVISITINGQTVPEGMKAIVTLASGTQVGVIWITPNNVVVVDKGEIV